MHTKQTDTWAYFETKLIHPTLQYKWDKVTLFSRWLPQTRQTTIALFDTSADLTARVLDALKPQNITTNNDDFCCSTSQSCTPVTAPSVQHHTRPIDNGFDPDANSNDYTTDPFWVYTRLATDIIVPLEDASVWAIRDHIRAMEKNPMPWSSSTPAGGNVLSNGGYGAEPAPTPAAIPRPDYRRLHDIARHAIHVTETLDVISETMQRILDEHDALQRTTIASTTKSGVGVGHVPTSDMIFNPATSLEIHNRLSFAHHMLTSLRHRAASNEKRLLNEIQLAFHTVAQHDASLSMHVSHLAQADGAAMKTIAFIGLAFLPPTFVSAIFSMSFFNFDGGNGNGWSVAGEIWIYWAVAVPLTCASFVAWWAWGRKPMGFAASGGLFSSHRGEELVVPVGKGTSSDLALLESAGQLRMKHL